MNNKRYNWGIIAPGNIAAQFAQALNSSKRARIHSVVSRDISRAQAFASRFDIAQATDTLDKFLSDPDLDVVYIASPHHCHAEQSIKALLAGNHVVCEKPFAVNSREGKAIIEAANTSGCFYLEAVWTRFLPIYQTVQHWLKNDIGELQSIKASFGIPAFADPKHRINNPDLAGGALLDLGIYPITLSDWATGEIPKSIKATAKISPTGVDATTAIHLDYESGVIASLLCSANGELDNQGWLFGSKGKIQIPNFWCAESATLYRLGQKPNTVSLPHCVNGYEYEIEAAHDSLDQNLCENPLFTPENSLRVVSIMDAVRETIGLRYPFETDVTRRESSH